jgi:3-carboxy-cis,cis-muconate cycloisomerase
VSLFAPLWVPARLREELSERAWVAAMLEAEAALAAAAAAEGAIPAEAADAIAAACRLDAGGAADAVAAAPRGAPLRAVHPPHAFDPARLGEEALGAGNPVVPLVAALRDAVGEPHAAHVHRGATSQDILDTAASLVAFRALAPILDDLGGAAGACARLAETHRDTVMAGRTLLQQALPITFGLKAAGWLDATLDARAGLLRTRLDAQLGGAAGTLAAVGDAGPAVARGFAERLGLGAPELPWHTSRGRVAELGAALAVAAGAVGKIALDLVLLAQTEVAEVRAGAGGSSAMPHKQNPIGAVRARACAQRVPPLAALLLGAMAQEEHERAAGAWHAEWEPLAQAFALTGGAACALRETLEELEVRPERMRANLGATGGRLLAERVAGALPAAARDEVTAATRAVGPFREALLARPAIAAHLDAAQIDDLLDPAGYLGASAELVARALARADRELGVSASGTPAGRERGA